MAIKTLADQHGWLVGIAGIVSIVFGVAAILWPGLTLAVFVLLFGVFAIVDGILSIVNVFVCIGAKRPWWPSLLLGIIGIAAGGFMLGYPGITAIVYVYVVAFWAMASGIMMILGSFATAKLVHLLAGVLTIVFGFVLLGNPLAGALALVFVIGFFAIVRGILFLFEVARPAEVQHLTA